MAQWGRRSHLKHGNIRTNVDGYPFDSLREARYYVHVLKPLLYAGEIRDLVVTKKDLRYLCTVNGVKICTYVADYRWVDRQGHVVVADAKGHRTREYQIKKKLMQACWGIDILEV